MKNWIFLLTSFLFFLFSSHTYAQTWSDVSPPWAAGNRTAYSMAAYGANLYVGTNNTGGAQVWQYNGTAWTNVTPAWAAANITAACMAAYGASLYVGTVNSSGGAQVWQYNGTAWTNVTPGWAAANAAAVGMAAYGTNLYAGTLNAGGAQVWQYNGTAWTNVSPSWAAVNRMAFSMAVYGANLYVGTVNSSGGAQVWLYNEAAWTNVTPGWAATNITAAGMAVYRSDFYVGTDNNLGGTAQVWQLELPVFPEQGTIGTEMTVKGSGFGAAKGKVLVGKAVLKILEWTDSLIGCQLTKAMSPGTYDVTIQPKARGASPIILENGFTVEPPEIGSTEPTNGSTGEGITVNGFFFGTTKGKVTLGGKNCRVLSWKMDPTTGESEIHFVVPKGLSLGAHELKVTNGVGSDTVSLTIK